MTTTASSASARLRELAAARLVLHDAREERAPRKRIWILLRQFVFALRALDVDHGKLRRRLSDSVNITIEHPDPRVKRLRYKRGIEREILSYYLNVPKTKQLDPRSQHFRDIVKHWMRSFDEREGLYASMQKAIWKALSQRTKIPYNAQGIAMLVGDVRVALREYEPEVSGRLSPDHTITIDVTAPSGIDQVTINARISF